MRGPVSGQSDAHAPAKQRRSVPRYRPPKPEADQVGGWSNLHGRRLGIPRSKNQELRRIARGGFFPLRIAALIFDRDGFRMRPAGWTKGVQSYADVVRNGEVVVVVVIEMAAPCGRDGGVGREPCVARKRPGAPSLRISLVLRSNGTVGRRRKYG